MLSERATTPIPLTLQFTTSKSASHKGRIIFHLQTVKALHICLPLYLHSWWRNYRRPYLCKQL